MGSALQIVGALAARPTRLRVGAALLVALVALSLRAPQPLRAQQPTLRFERLSAANGLSHDRVYDIVQDQAGLIWLATGEGLNRYDGYRFRVYTFDPDRPDSLSDSVISALHVDSAGALWVGTRRGLNRFERGSDSFTRFQHDPDDPWSLSSNSVGDIAEDRQGRLWVSSPAGADRLDPATRRFAPAAFEPPLPAPAPGAVGGARLLLDRSGALWAGTPAGLYRLDPSSDSFVLLPLGDEAPAPAISALFEDSQGALWIGTGEGLTQREAGGALRRYRHQEGDARSLSDDAVLAVAEDRLGTLWVGTQSGGLNALDRATGRFSAHRHDPLNPHSLAGDTASVLYVDRGGLLWISASRRGVSIHSPATRRFEHYTHSPGAPGSISAQNIAAVYEDSQGIIWSGGYNEDGLSALDRARGTVTVYRHDPADPNSLSHDAIYELYEDRAGTLWVGTLEGGLNRFDRATGRFSSFRHDPQDPTSLSNEIIPAILEDSGGRLWVGTEDGLNLLDRERGAFRVFRHSPDAPQSLGNSEVSHLYEDARGTLWVGTWGGGLNRFDPRTETFTRYQNDSDDPATISDDRIFSIDGDAEGNLWIGTYFGLNKFSPASGRFTRYTEQQGLPARTARCVLVDRQGYVWVGSSSNLTRFDPRTETFTRFDEADGLQSYGFNGGACSKSRSGELLFGGLNGFNAFFPETIRPEAPPPPVVLTGVSVLNEPLELGAAPEQLSGLALGYDASVVTFEFAALDYADPRANSYAYKLEGFDADWVLAGEQRSATYSRLPGGKYTFRVRAANSEGTWAEQGLALPVSVAVAPWRSWWAYSLYALALAALVGGAARYATQAQTNRRLQAEVAERLRAEQEQARLYEVARSLREVLAAINSNSSLPEILRFIVGQATGMLGVAACQIYRLCPGDEGEGDYLEVEASQGFASGYVGVRLRTAPHMASYRAARERRPIEVPDARPLFASLLAQPRFEPDQQRLIAEARARFGALLAVPLIVGGDEVYGTITLYNAEPRVFSEEELNLARAFAAQSALAIENAYLREQLEQAAAREERLRMARDLHDSVSQSLYSLELLSEDGRLSADERALPELARQFARLGTLARDALGEMRLLIYQQRPPDLDEIGLAGAIQRRLELVERRAGIAVDFAAEPFPALPPAYAEQVFRIVQEALNNALKHGDPSAVAVRLRSTTADGRTLLEVEVRDDGRGFDVASTQAGFGTQSMRERAAAIGATLDIRSSPGEGSTLLLQATLGPVSA